MKLRWLLGLGLLVFLGWAVASPLLTLRGLQQAILGRNQAAMERYVDFPLVRQNLTHDLTERVRQQLDAKDQNALGRLATMFTGGVINQIVNFIVTPEGLANIGADTLSSAQSNQKGSVEAVKNWRLRLRSPTTLQIYGTNNGGAGLEMQLRGLGWKVVRVNLGG